MNNISFKGFYHIEPVDNKKVNMKLVSEMVKTIPNTESIGCKGKNAKTFFIPDEEETKFEKLAEALRAKSLVNIKSINIKKTSIDTLIETRIRDFSPSDKYTYVIISADFMKKIMRRSNKKGADETYKNNIFQVGLQKTKINIPQLTATRSAKNKKNSEVLDMQMTNEAQQTIFSLLKLGYKEIPLKISKGTHNLFEQISKDTGTRIIEREISIKPLEE